MAEFIMPTLGADMTEGTLVQWKKREGDPIAKGEIIAEVDTEKAAIEVESHHSGVIERLLSKPGDKVAVGTVMALIREAGQPAAPVSPTPAPMPPTPVRPAMPAPAGGRRRISPAARTLAESRGVDLSRLQGSGPDGAITLADVERAAGSAEPTETVDRQAKMRQTIAAAMSRSKREIPHYYLGTTIDMGLALAWLKERNERLPVTARLLPVALLIKAVALALTRVPELNALWNGSTAVRSERIHIGVAISLRQGGLIAPALHDADRLSLGELMARFQDLVKRARAGSLRSSELSDPTITVTSLGDQGVETVFGVIYPPQVALVGFGKIVERPWVLDGRLVARPIMTASLSADHRVTDGHRGGLLLAKIDRLLQEPHSL
ncbi:MAG: 2-oxo acid dehydrogenase subunit E2 [Nitrospira sp. NTP2]|nr:2-oxo acid dehydrogenase subunit E2 [Nitrospira sp. NTP2]RIK60547.1 MAG: 2-oxo acid dehydrogenase subunit E2 [Nitrospira sp.]